LMREDVSQFFPLASAACHGGGRKGRRTPVLDLKVTTQEQRHPNSWRLRLSWPIDINRPCRT